MRRSTAPRRSERAGQGPLGDLGLVAAQRRRALGMTQRELASLVEVSERSIQSLEVGKPTMRADVLIKVLDGLGLALVAMPKSVARRHESSASVVVRSRDEWSPGRSSEQEFS